MADRNIPNVFGLLLRDMCINKPNIAKTFDGFFVVNKSIANINIGKENNTMRKSLSVLFLVVMFACVLTGCGFAVRN
jgi:hypothetical protein